MQQTLFIKQYSALMDGVNHPLSLMANTSAFLFQEMDDISWAGFYLLENNQLILGPFQGKIACTTIPLGSGVCGQSASSQTSLLVDDVHTFDGHIACDAASNSELVVPIIVNKTLYGVLDLDSTSFSRFQKIDQQQIEELVHILELAITKTS